MKKIFAILILLVVLIFFLEYDIILVLIRGLIIFCGIGMMTIGSIVISELIIDKINRYRNRIDDRIIAKNKKIIDAELKIK